MGKKGKDKNERSLLEFKKEWAIDKELEQYIEHPIYQALSFYVHAETHTKQYVSREAYHSCLERLKEIIETNEDIIYEKRKKGLHFFKYFPDINQSIKLTLNINENNELFIATIFPFSKNKRKKLFEKIEEDNEKYLIELYTHKEKD